MAKTQIQLKHNETLEIASPDGKTVVELYVQRGVPGIYVRAEFPHDLGILPESGNSVRLVPALRGGDA